MDYSDNQLKLMSLEDVIGLDKEVRLHWFRLLQVRHRELEKITRDLAHLLHPDNETRIVALIGMTGVGKTTLARLILQMALAKVWGSHIAPWDVPYIFVAAPANGEKSLSWRVLYQRILRAALEILVDQKQQTQDSDDFISLSRGKNTVAALRESVESMLKNRNVRLVVIDEAVHLLRFEAYAAVMDTLKSLADVHKTKILLIGSYDLYDLVTDYGQTARRGEILHYKRYNGHGRTTKDNIAADQDEFANIVKKLQEKWPSCVVPNLEAIADDLMEATLGSVGLLKALLVSALELQLNAKSEKWDPRYLIKAAKSLKLIKRIRDETVVGEEKLSGASFGESYFSDPAIFAKVAAKMA